MKSGGITMTARGFSKDLGDNVKGIFTACPHDGDGTLGTGGRTGTNCGVFVNRIHNVGTNLSAI